MTPATTTAPQMAATALHFSVKRAARPAIRLWDAFLRGEVCRPAGFRETFLQGTWRFAGFFADWALFAMPDDAPLPVRKRLIQIRFRE